MTKLRPVSLSEIRAEAAACLRALLTHVSNRSASAVHFAVARVAVDTLPLSTAEAATAKNRLDNAWAYLQAGEHGAASYELRLLAHDPAVVGVAG